ncbi:MAG: hypothetical protein IBJ14_12230 [Hydrogenophaga sp.]|nr:hypothetical protein [Hydrogenophaga sp.]
MTFETRTTPAQWLSAAWHIATGQRTAVPPGPASAASMALAVLLFVAFNALMGRVFILGEARFSWSDWWWGWARTALFVGVAWFGLALWRPAGRPAVSTSAWLVLYWVASLLPAGLYGLWWAMSARQWLPAWSGAGWLLWTLYGAMGLWWVVIAWRAARGLGASALRATGLGLAVVATQLASSWWLQDQAWTRDTPGRTTAPLQLSQEGFEAQETLFAQALDAVAARADGPAQVFGIVYAPYDEGVFLREAALVTRAMSEHLGAAGHTITLLNHRSTATQQPWATPRNLRVAIETMAQRMDPERDLLVLYLTSHGGQDHRLASQLWPLTVAPLDAVDVKAWLDEHRIRHRAVIVSACYSGGWVPPLADDDTLVMTSSAADRVSYGCGEDSPLTYFGEALFQHALPQTRSLEDAFALAVPHIVAQEARTGLADTPSNPQIHVGPRFRERWQAWQQGRGAAR